MPGSQASGAYIFRPDGTTLYNVSTNVTLEKIGKDVMRSFLMLWF